MDTPPEPELAPHYYERRGTAWHSDTIECDVVAFGDASGGPYTSHPQLRRVSWATVIAPARDEGEMVGDNCATSLRPSPANDARRRRDDYLARIQQRLSEASCLLQIS